MPNKAARFDVTINYSQTGLSPAQIVQNMQQVQQATQQQQQAAPAAAAAQQQAAAAVTQHANAQQTLSSALDSAQKRLAAVTAAGLSPYEIASARARVETAKHAEEHYNLTGKLTEETPQLREATNALYGIGMGAYYANVPMLSFVSTSGNLLNGVGMMAEGFKDLMGDLAPTTIALVGVAGVVTAIGMAMISTVTSTRAMIFAMRDMAAVSGQTIGQVASGQNMAGIFGGDNAAKAFGSLSASGAAMNRQQIMQQMALAQRGANAPAYWENIPGQDAWAHAGMTQFLNANGEQKPQEQLMSESALKMMALNDTRRGEFQQQMGSVMPGGTQALIDLYEQMQLGKDSGETPQQTLARMKKQGQLGFHPTDADMAKQASISSNLNILGTRSKGIVGTIGNAFSGPVAGTLQGTNDVLSGNPTAIMQGIGLILGGTGGIGSAMGAAMSASGAPPGTPGGSAGNQSVGQAVTSFVAGPMNLLKQSFQDFNPKLIQFGTIFQGLPYNLSVTGETSQQTVTPVNFMTQAFGTLVTQIGSIPWDQWGATISGWGQSIKDTFNTLTKPISDFYNNNWLPFIANPLAALGITIKIPSLPDILTWLKGVLGIPQDFSIKIPTISWDGMLLWLKGIYDGAVGFVMGFRIPTITWDGVILWLKGIYDSAVGFVMGFRIPTITWDGVLIWLKGIYDGAVGFIMGFSMPKISWDGVLIWLKGIYDNALGFVMGFSIPTITWDGVLIWLKGIYNDAAGYVMGFRIPTISWDNVLLWLKGILDNAAGYVLNFHVPTITWDNVLLWLKGIGDTLKFDIAIPNITIPQSLQDILNLLSGNNGGSNNGGSSNSTTGATNGGGGNPTSSGPPNNGAAPPGLDSSQGQWENGSSGWRWVLNGSQYGYATGGVALTPQIASLAENGPEAIIPMSQMQNMGGHTFNISINGMDFSDPSSMQQIATAVGNQVVRNLQVANGIGFRPY